MDGSPSGGRQTLKSLDDAEDGRNSEESELHFRFEDVVVVGNDRRWDEPVFISSGPKESPALCKTPFDTLQLCNGVAVRSQQRRPARHARDFVRADRCVHDLGRICLPLW